MKNCASFLRCFFRGRLALGGLLAVCLTAISLSAWAGNYEIGLKLYSGGDYEAASRYFRAAAKEDAGNHNAHYYLADSYLKLNRLAEAQAEYQKILVMAPDSQAGRLSRLGLSRLRRYFDNMDGERWQLTGKLGDRKKPDRFLGSYGEDTYLDDVLESGRIVRWSLSHMPLKVYIERAPQGIRNFQPGFIEQVRRALDVWVGVLGHQISYVATNKQDEGDIQVTWVNTIDTRGHDTDGGTAYTAGLVVPKLKGDQIQSMDMKIATFDIKGNPQSADTIYAVAVHEMGHALGLLGHSDNAADIMYAQNQHVTQPSERDKNTLRKLYASAADITNLPPEEREADPEREAELAKRLDASIAKLETQAEKDNMALTWMNLGVEYYQKAKLVAEGAPDPKDPKTDPNYWYKKSLEVTEKALALEPKDPRAHHKLSLIYQELGDYPKALQAISKASSLDKRETEYYLVQSWCLAKVGRSAQARNVLDTYLLHKPGEAGSADVQKILMEIRKQSGT